MGCKFPQTGEIILCMNHRFNLFTLFVCMRYIVDENEFEEESGFVERKEEEDGD